jgi:hypothetical protein
MSTQSRRSRARLHYRNRRRLRSRVVLMGRKRPVSFAALGRPAGHVPIMCVLSNGRAADRISVPKP